MSSQVAAFMALMECARGERPGVLNNRLYHRTLRAVVGGAGTAPEVLGLLIARLLGAPLLRDQASLVSLAAMLLPVPGLLCLSLPLPCLVLELETGLVQCIGFSASFDCGRLGCFSLILAQTWRMCGTSR
jgi:hypothetical protein